MTVPPTPEDNFDRRDEFDRWLDERLAALPLMHASAGFADRVMQRVALPDPFAIRFLAAARHRLLATRRSLAVAATIAVLLVGSLAGSIVWTLGHQEALVGFGGWLASRASELAWVGLRGAASNLVEQPWYSEARKLATSPAQLATVSALASLGYAAAIVALRRLLAPPPGAVTHVAG